MKRTAEGEEGGGGDADISKSCSEAALSRW